VIDETGKKNEEMEAADKHLTWRLTSVIHKESIMRNNMKNWKIIVAMIGIIVVLAIVPMPGARACKDNPYPHYSQVIPPNAHPFGKSYGEWSAEWWEWQIKLPATDHPAYSLDGANCDAGQSGMVWFLTGAFTTEVPADFNTIIRESCSVPVGKAIFFPIINVECSTIEAPPFHGETPEELLSCAKSWFDGTNAVAKDLKVTIDGKTLENLELEPYRFQSPVFNFSFEDTTDNILGVSCCEVNCSNPQSVSDGYWIMLAPLSKGEHTIRFIGSFRDPMTDALIFGLDVTYILSVVGR